MNNIYTNNLLETDAKQTGHTHLYTHTLYGVWPLYIMF